MGHPQHLDRKCDSKVRIGDRASFAEDTLNSLLGPRPILESSIQNEHKSIKYGNPPVVALPLRALHPFQWAQDEGNLHT